MGNEYDLNIELEINKLLISDSDAELEENDENANNWEQVMRRPKRIPRQQQDHGPFLNLLAFITIF